MFRILSEWGIDHERVIFNTIEDANKWLLENKVLVQCYEEGLSGQDAVDDLVGAGLISFQELWVYGG